MLLTIDDVLTREELAAASSMLAGSPWVSGKITAGTQAIQVKNNLQLPETAPHMADLRRLVLGALHRNALFFTATLPGKIVPPFFNRYSGDTNHYGFHVDNAMRLLPDGNGYARADISATLFLSDPQEYEGGELVVNDTFGQHGVKLQAGSMVIYPSSSVHQVTPVTRGERTACFMFIQSMVRDPNQRRLLYEMDMALLQLRQSIGETDAVVSLTGTYHNLLRQWADS